MFDNDILIIKVRITPINFFTLQQFSIFATCPFHNFVFRKLPDQLPGVQRRCGERSRLLGKENILLNFNSLGNKIIASIIQWGPLLAWVIFQFAALVIQCGPIKLCIGSRMLHLSYNYKYSDAHKVQCSVHRSILLAKTIFKLQLNLLAF